MGTANRIAAYKGTMNTALWIAAIVLALVFFFVGVAKLFQPKEKLAESGMGWTEDVDPMAIKGIGLLEVLGAIGLVIPAWTNILPGLVPWAAAGIAIIMLGAMATHARRKEWPMIGGNIVLLAIAVFVMWGRFTEYAF